MRQKFLSLLVLGASLAGLSSCEKDVKYTIDVTPKSPSLYEGSSLKITVKSDPEGLPLPEVGISFSPEGIASVDVVNDGYMLKGLKAGKTTMTLSYGELSHEVQIQVKKKSSNNDAPSGGDGGGNSSSSSDDGGGSSSGDDSGSGDKEPSDDQGGETPVQPGDGGNEGEENPSTDPITPTPGEEEGGEENPGEGDTDPIIPTPGEETTEHEYVDLGLSVLWATCNVGAENPWDYGQYFAWGETQGYAKGEAHTFNWDNYVDNPSGDGKTFTTYHNDEGGLTELTADHDAATENWGGKWRMPSKADFDELLNKEKIYSAWVTNYKSSNVSGRVFYKKKEGEATYDVNSDVHIFLPAAGYRGGSNLGNEGSNGYCWSRSLNESDSSNNAWYLDFYPSNANATNNSRCYGRSVRPVLEK